MNNPIGSNDPLNPAYPHDPGKLQPVKRIGGLGSRTNVAVLILIAVAILAALLFLAREKPDPTAPPPPAATGIQ